MENFIGPVMFLEGTAEYQITEYHFLDTFAKGYKVPLTYWIKNQ